MGLQGVTVTSNDARHRQVKPQGPVPQKHLSSPVTLTLLHLSQFGDNQEHGASIDRRDALHRAIHPPSYDQWFDPSCAMHNKPARQRL